jgi:hypothetical protein
MDRVNIKFHGLICRFKNHDVALLSTYARSNDLTSLIEKMNDLHGQYPGPHGMESKC